MIIPRIPAAAAKQVVDSVRVYRQYRRLLDELKEVEGSMLWKQAGAYEYLARKVKGKFSYLGARNTQTEAQYTAFAERKSKLSERARVLKQSVLTCQRMNKAVRAGSVPTPVINALGALEDAGLSRQCMVLGAPALYAYSQISGIQLESAIAEGMDDVLTDARTHLVLMLEKGDASSAKVIAQLRKGAEAGIQINPVGTGQKTWLALELKWAEDVPSRPASDGYWFALAPYLIPVLEKSPRFEQVVIGKTGKMAIMSTVDPLFFTALNTAIDHAKTQALGTSCSAHASAKLVKSMIAEYLVEPKMDLTTCSEAVSAIARRTDNFKEM